VATKAQLITFTPNTIAEYDKVLNAGADVVMTDNPSTLKKYLQSK
jgi:glycerophosphoryl diester phosphodiesterase